MGITILFFFCLVFLYLAILSIAALISEGASSIIGFFWISLLPLIDILLWTWLFFLLHK
jgi:hypothetical protein